MAKRTNLEYIGPSKYEISLIQEQGVSFKKKQKKKE